MKLIEKLNSYSADWIDVALIKIGVFVATLLLAKFWSTILSFEWYLYAIVWLIVAIRPVKKYLNWMKPNLGRENN